MLLMRYFLIVSKINMTDYDYLNFICCLLLYKAHFNLWKRYTDHLGTTIGTIIKVMRQAITNTIIIFNLQFLQYIILYNSVALWLNWWACSKSKYIYISMTKIFFPSLQAALGFQSFFGCCQLLMNESIYLKILLLPCCFGFVLFCLHFLNLSISCIFIGLFLSHVLSETTLLYDIVHLAQISILPASANDLLPD